MTPAPPLPRDLAAALRNALTGDVQFDEYSRHMYATDASMYAIEPIGVVYPCHQGDVQAAVRIAADFGVPVLPRGAGTSLAGQTVGAAVILDFSRHMTGIIQIDPRSRTAIVEPGVVQDDLNRAAAEHGLLFAPDTSTANRATLGGMIGNNSCGARSARYGMTVDHVVGLDVVLADGSVARFEAMTESEVTARADQASDSLERTLYQRIPSLVRDHAEVIRSAMPAHWRRSGGYRLERMLPDAGPFNLAHLVVGSEGTLALTTQATVRLVPLPGAVTALVGHFESVDAALRAAPVAMAAGATTVELVDKMILDLARESPVHGHLPGLLEGDPGAILWVEFYGDGEVTAARADATAAMEGLRARWSAEGHGYAVLTAPTPDTQAGFRALRKAGLGLLMSAGTGGERSLAFVEDTAVAPERLAEYTQRLVEILDEHGLRAGFYGHASAGTLHIRPFMNLARPGAPERMRSVAESVLALVREFGGMNSSEHGDGLARGEFNRAFFGDAYYGLMQEVKRTFDPAGLLNPGKKVDVAPMTENLRAAALQEAGALETWFAFGGAGERSWAGGERGGRSRVDGEGDGGIRIGGPGEAVAPANRNHAGRLTVGGAAEAGSPMRDAADRCARIGACRKSAAAGGVMCPSYMATRQEEHATRGRANALVAALSEPDPRAALSDDRLHEILDLCLECKACKVECPLHVDMATLKSEALAHRHEVHGVPLRDRLFGNVRALNRIGSAAAPMSNWPGGWGVLRGLFGKATGIDPRRPLPRFQRETLQKWFGRRGRGRVGPAMGEGIAGSASGAAVGGGIAGSASGVGVGGGMARSASTVGVGGRIAGSAEGRVGHGGMATSVAEPSGREGMARSAHPPTRGPLRVLADSFTSYTEPEIGRACIELLEMAGWTVELVGDVCCGRSLISKGMLREARARHAHLLARLGGLALLSDGGAGAEGRAGTEGRAGAAGHMRGQEPGGPSGIPITGCEPSCLLTLMDEVPALAAGSHGSADDVRAAASVARRARLVDDLLADALDDGSLVIDPDADVVGRPILFHGHCHQKAASATAGSVRVLRAISGDKVAVLDAGCCGMAGSFGFEAEHYDLSMQIGRQRLFPAVERTPADAFVAATGVSCRQQIAHGTGRTAEHPAVLLRRAVRQR